MSAGDIVAELADCWFRRVETDPAALCRRARACASISSPPHSPKQALLAPLTISARPCRASGATHEPPQAQQDQALLLDALVGAVALRSLSRLVEPGRSFTIGELSRSGQIAPDSAALTEASLRLLERLGRSQQKPRRNGSSHRRTIYPEVGDVWRLLLAESPDLVSGTRPRSERGGGSAENSRRRPQAAGRSTFPNGRAFAPGFAGEQSGIALLCAALEEFAKSWPKHRPLRVLELGASAGGATRRILNLLTRSKVAFAYLATSADPEHAGRLGALAESYVGVSSLPVGTARRKRGAR